MRKVTTRVYGETEKGLLLISEMESIVPEPSDRAARGDAPGLAIAGVALGIGLAALLFGVLAARAHQNRQPPGD